MKKIIVLILSISLILTPTLAQNCTIRFGSCAENEVCILSMNQTNNSHAAHCNYYGYKLCCTDIRSSRINETCAANENEILSMNATENAHVARPGYYGYKVCVDWLNCNIANSCNGLTCTASLNNTINSHIAECNYYGYKLCCGECDFNETFCQDCFNRGLTPRCTAWPCWNLGGDLPGATNCCGDDIHEYKITKTCAVGVCDSDPNDDACCSTSDKCVWNSVCYDNGWAGDIDGDGVYEECSAGIWILKPPWWRILWRDIVKIITKILGIS
jgi:hypothetical protein